jgi:TolA-binding protein
VREGADAALAAVGLTAAASGVARRGSSGSQGALLGSIAFALRVEGLSNTAIRLEEAEQHFESLSGTIEELSMYSEQSDYQMPSVRYTKVIRLVES